MDGYRYFGDQAYYLLLIMLVRKCLIEYQSNCKRLDNILVMIVRKKSYDTYFQH